MINRPFYFRQSAPRLQDSAGLFEMIFMTYNQDMLPFITIYSVASRRLSTWDIHISR